MAVVESNDKENNEMLNKSTPMTIVIQIGNWLIENRIEISNLLNTINIISMSIRSIRSEWTNLMVRQCE